VKMTMEYDTEKVAEITMALLWLGLHDVNQFGARAWKGFDWDALNRLHEKGLIDDPKSKAKSVWMPAESVEYARSLFEKYFGLSGTQPTA